MTDPSTASWRQLAGRSVDDPAQPPLLSELLDPVVIFAKLVREVEAAQVLVSLSTTPGDTRTAALDGLALARDVLADARLQLDQVGCDSAEDREVSL